jgi:AhpD family alkylhydroperoxidase
MLGLESHLAGCGLDSKLLELLKVRVSQVNGCAYCIDKHWRGARAHGETEQRLYALDAWRESTFYSEYERTALAWAEAVTSLDHGHVPDSLHEIARGHFDDRELVDLTLAVAAINAWNRLCISFRSQPDAHVPDDMAQLAPQRTTQ